MAAWPSSLPKFQLPTEIKAQENIIRTEMDAGAAKSRRRFTAQSYFYSLNMEMSGAQYQTLIDFYNSNLEFTMEDPRTGVISDFVFLKFPAGRVVVGDSNPDNRVYRVVLNVEKKP